MEKIALIRVVQDDYDGHFKVVLDSKGHLGEVQHQRHQGVRQEQGYPKILILRVGLRNNGSP